jgi:hypothetical protein
MFVDCMLQVGPQALDLIVFEISFVDCSVFKFIKQSVLLCDLSPFPS